MKAIVLNQSSYSLELKNVETPVISDSDVLIKIKSASLNHHELWTLQNKTLKSDKDIILGSDGCGIIEKAGSSVTHFQIGDEVILNPSLNWGEGVRAQGTGYEILGHPTRGTFAEYISIDSKYIAPKPLHLSFEESAALPLAGLTAYRALFTRGEFEKGNRVLITGIGGGAALLAMNFAVVSGAEVYVTSGSGDKLTRAIKLGAKGGVIYRDKNWGLELKNLADGFDVIIDSAAGEGFSELVELALPGARIVLFGRTAGNIASLNPKTIFWKQLSIHGTTMGTPAEFENMLKLVSEKEIYPVVDSVYLADTINQAFAKMEEGKQFGKLVINMHAV